MIKLYDGGAYLLNGTEIVESAAAGQGQAPQRPATSGIFVLADSLPPAGEPLCI